MVIIDIIKTYKKVDRKNIMMNLKGISEETVGRIKTYEKLRNCVKIEEKYSD